MVNGPANHSLIAIRLLPTCCKMKCDLFPKYVLDTNDIGNSLYGKSSQCGMSSEVNAMISSRAGKQGTSHYHSLLLRGSMHLQIKQMLCNFLLVCGFILKLA